MYQRMDPLSDILKVVEKALKDVERVGEFSEELRIAKSIPTVVPQWYAQKCEDFLF